MRYVIQKKLFSVCLCALLGSCSFSQPPAPETVKTPLLFEEAFAPGTQFWINKEPVFFRVITLGNLEIPSGQIVAGDPAINKQLPYTSQFPSGAYPVQLAIAQTLTRRFNALLKIQFSNKEIDYWKMALRPGQNLQMIHAQQFFGAVVKSEKIMLMDFAAYANLRSKLNSYQEVRDQIEKKFNLLSGFSKMELNFTDTTLNSELVVVTPGVGNGTYAAYIAYDVENKPVAFLLDFYVVPWANP